MLTEPAHESYVPTGLILACRYRFRNGRSLPQRELVQRGVLTRPSLRRHGHPGARPTFPPHPPLTTRYVLHAVPPRQFSASYFTARSHDLAYTERDATRQPQVTPERDLANLFSLRPVRPPFRRFR